MYLAILIRYEHCISLILAISSYIFSKVFSNILFHIGAHFFLTIFHILKHSNLLCNEREFIYNCERELLSV